jgi:hypothetical protein
MPILQDHLVNDVSTNNASPPEKFSIFTIEFFINHGTIASVAFHNTLLINNI